MGKFKQYLNEINKNKLMTNTDKARIDQAVKEMRVRPPKVRELDNGLERMSYRFKMQPPEKSVEGKAHWGYVDYDLKTKDIRQLWCSCKDFSYRLYFPLEKNGLATWQLDKQFRKKEPFVHNRAAAVETNPQNKLFVCKHIYALLNFYMED